MPKRQSTAHSSREIPGKLTGEREKSALAAIPPIIWALVAVIAALSMLVGYLLANGNVGASNQAAQEQAAQGQPTQPGQPGNAAQPGQPGQPVTYPPAGTRTEPPQPKADGTFDATIVGPGKEIKSAEDILHVHRRKANDPFAIGALDAPVVVSEFSDFECPFCSRHANNTEPQILKEYVEKGLVRLEWNDLPINGPKAVSGAKAGRAAAEQGKFFEFKEALYKASESTNGHPEYGMEDFVKFAEEAGVKDIAAFKKAASGSKFDDAVQEARMYGAGIGINGTPGFIIGTQFVNGAQPWEVFKQAIDAELSKVASGEVKVPAV